MSKFESTKIIELGSCAFRQWRASHSHCRFLHGYQLKAKIWFGASSLDEKNWCVDFGGLKDLKEKLKNIFDHTTTVAADDPELSVFEDLDKRGIIQLRVLDKGVGIERVAEIVFSIANSFIKTHTNDRCWVEKIEVFEHEENSATYTEKKCCVSKQITTSPASCILSGHLDQMSVDPNKTVTVDSRPSKAAHVGPNVTQGKGNWFSGTSWGN
jgi:6-pyruvoyltetrahydropterin/6-carboxytetrahydropterin synthase